MKMATKMELSMRRLGQTEIEVSPIGLGVMQFSGGGKGMISKAFPPIDHEGKTEIIQAAIDGGINWFDTAEIYGFGRSEAGLSSALKTIGKRDEEIIVATKWWPLFRTAHNIPKTINDRIRFLDEYSIDLYYVHQPFSFSSPEAEMDAMANLVEAGIIRTVGVSNFNAERMIRAHKALAKRGISLAANQMHYSLLNRKIERDGVLKAAKELRITIVAYTPLGYGLLTGIYHKHPELLEQKLFYQRGRLRRNLEASRLLVEGLSKIAEKYNVLPGQVALNWLVTFHGDTVVTIPGASKVSHAEQSAGAMKFRLTEEELGRIDKLSQKFL